MKRAAGSRQQAVTTGRRKTPGFVFAACCLLPAACFLAGCATFGPTRNPTGSVGPPPALDRPPDAAQVVAYLNANAALINSVESHDVDIDVKMGTGVGQQIGVSGVL